MVKIIQFLIQSNLVGASEVYIKACNKNGKPPVSWAEDVARYVRMHIKNEEELSIYFPNLPLHFKAGNVT